MHATTIMETIFTINSLQYKILTNSHIINIEIQSPIYPTIKNEINFFVKCSFCLKLKKVLHKKLKVIPTLIPTKLDTNILIFKYLSIKKVKLSIVDVKRPMIP